MKEEIDTATVPLTAPVTTAATLEQHDQSTNNLEKKKVPNLVQIKREMTLHLKLSKESLPGTS